MKHFRKISLPITVILLGLCMLCSCGEKKPDLSSISDIPGEFIEALQEYDKDAIETYAPGLNLDEWDELDDTHIQVLQDIISYAKVTETGEPVYYEETGSTVMEVTISYIPVSDMTRSFSGNYTSISQLRESMEEYEDDEDKTMDLDFEYDEESEKWYLAKSSARKITRLFSEDSIRRLVIADITPDEAEEIFRAYLRDIADCWDAASMPENIDVQEYRYYDDYLHAGEGPLTQDALAHFVSAYMDYILTHDPNIVRDWDYSFELNGYAPSSVDLQEALYSDEYQIGYHANFIRYAKLGMRYEDMMDAQVALIYDTLAKAIPQCGTERYNLYGNVSPYADMTDECELYGKLVNGPYSYDNSTEVTEDQYEYYMISAIKLLLDNGEIDEAQYDNMIESALSVDEAVITDVSVSPSGHPNQAVGTYEYVPSWETEPEPVLIYGVSEDDENGFNMFYSKEVGWLHTAGYCIDDDGIWIATYFDRMFYPGNEVIVDWWLDNEQIVDTQVIMVAELTNAVEVFLPVDEFPADAYYEMRLWEADHRHVLAYVILTR